MEDLSKLLDEAGLQVSFDPERDITKPCIICGTAERPRTLPVVGYNPVAQEPLRRPVCDVCITSLVQD